MKALFPGSFNPIHNTHVKIIEKAAIEYDFLYIFVANNEEKEYSISVSERAKMLTKVVGALGLNNVKVIEQKPGEITPLVAKELEVSFIVRGIKEETIKYEEELESKYKEHNPSLSFIKYSFDNNVSSTKIRELIKSNQDITNFVPSIVKEDIINKYKEIK